MTKRTTKPDTVFKPTKSPTAAHPRQSATPYRYSYYYSSQPSTSARPVAKPAQARGGNASQQGSSGRYVGWWGSLTLIGILTVLGVVAYGGFHASHARGLAKAQKDSAMATPTAPQLQPAAVADPALGQSINQIIDKYSYLQVGVVMVSVADGKTASYGVSDPYVAASVDKLLSSTAFLHQVDIGQASLSQRLSDGNTAQTDLQQMIVQSDNDAWSSLNDYLSYPTIRAYAKSIGITSYDSANNIVAPTDIAQLLYKLYGGKLLSDSSRTLLLGYMKQANYTDYIMSAIPSGVTAYHKAGLLDDRVNDVAIIDNGKTAYVLVIFSKADSGGYDFSAGQQMFHAITATTTQHLLN